MQILKIVSRKFYSKVEKKCMEYLYKYFNPFFKDTKEINREKSKQLFKENFSLSINNVYHNYVSLKIKYKI